MLFVVNVFEKLYDFSLSDFDPDFALRVRQFGTARGEALV